MGFVLDLVGLVRLVLDVSFYWCCYWCWFVCLGVRVYGCFLFGCFYGVLAVCYRIVLGCCFWGFCVVGVLCFCVFLVSWYCWRLGCCSICGWLCLRVLGYWIFCGRCWWCGYVCWYLLGGGFWLVGFGFLGGLGWCFVLAGWFVRVVVRVFVVVLDMYWFVVVGFVLCWLGLCCIVCWFVICLAVVFFVRFWWCVGCCCVFVSIGFVLLAGFVGLLV